MTKEEKIQVALDQVKEYVNEELSNPFRYEVSVSEGNGRIILDSGYWTVELGEDNQWLSVSTSRDYEIGLFDQHQIMDIRDNKDTILEIYKGSYNKDEYRVNMQRLNN